LNLLCDLSSAEGAETAENGLNAELAKHADPNASAVLAVPALNLLCDLSSAEGAETAENGLNAELAKHADPKPLRSQPSLRCADSSTI
jgi:hypothetical protein